MGGKCEHGTSKQVCRTCNSKTFCVHDKHNRIHTIGVKSVGVARHGARFAILNQPRVSDCSGSGTINHNIRTPLSLL